MTNNRPGKDDRHEKVKQLRAQRAAAEARRRMLMIIGSVVAAVLLVAAVAVIVKVAQHDKKLREATEPQGLVASSFVVGKADAPVTMRIYEDFLCPACGQFEKTNREAITSLVADGTLRVEYRPVAILDRASSPAGYATRAASASAAVFDSKPEVWKAFHDSLFDNQPEEGGPGLSDDRLVQLAEAAGAPGDAVQSALSEKRYEAWVAKVTENATTEDKLTGTPTILLAKTSAPDDRKQLEDWGTESLKKAVAELAAK